MRSITRRSSRARETQCGGEQLEDEGAILGPVSVPAQGGQGQRVGRVVGEIEPAVERESLVPRIDESSLSGTDESVVFTGRGRLALELFDGDQVLELRRGHRPIR